MAKLVIRSGHNVGAEFPIKDALVHLGRRSQSEVPINDTKSSREHALIRVGDGDLHLQDLSRNGTFVNDKPASKDESGTALKFGDKIRIGDTVFELVDEKSEPIDIDIPSYKIIEKVGSGGMGTVYKARQLSMDRIVALKVLNERYSNNAEFVDRFIREARAAGKLNHPNVIHVHDISRANGRHYFSMEFIDGPSVRELLKQEKRIEINKALDIVLQAAKALEFAHENRIVHRDIKPDNIMLTREGIVKIADLGIAKTFEEGPPSAKDARTVMGTPHYMAPEQALGKAIDHRVDIYSLGATFYHMVTGATPFHGTTSQEILKAHVQASLLPMQDLNAGIPDPVCFIVERMMAKLPEKRYQNMARVIEDIEKVQSGRVKGIERIEADDSSILRAVKVPAATSKEKTADGTKKSASPVKKRTIRERTEELTGAQIPVGKIASLLFWLALLAVAIAAIIKVPQYLNANKPAMTEGDGKHKPPALPSKPEARALLLEAKNLLAKNEFVESEELLLQVRKKFDETIEGEEANVLLVELLRAKREAARIKGEALLAEAQKFEAANAGKSAEILLKYKDALAAATGNAKLYNEIKTQINQLEKVSVASGTQSGGTPVSSSVKEVLDKAEALKAAFDFDGARKLLKDFMYSTQVLEDGADARKYLGKIEDAAAAKVAEVTEKTKTLDALNQALEWGKYTSTVKDAVNAPKIAPILEGLEDKTQDAAMEDLKKGGDKFKAGNISEALEAMQQMQKKWAGMKWAVMARSKENSYKSQKDLYDKFLAGLKEKTAAGPLALPFPIQTKIKNQTKWSVVGMQNESIVLDPIPKNAAPGVSAKLYELSPKDQYELMLFALPKELTPELHKQIQLLCIERGLSDEADKHEKKAGEGK